MNTDTLRLLLSQNEDASLEFKQEWYKIDSANEAAAEAEKNELIKDILSLANGNSSVFAETAYLVIGVANELDVDGNRQLFDIAFEKPVTQDRLMKIINAACRPRLPNLILEQIPLDGKNLIVISIPASPHLHETTKRLKMAKRAFDECTVFIRYGDDIQVASTQERIELAPIKKTRFEEARNAPPTMFGAGIGAIVGATLVPTFVRRYAKTNEETIASGLVSFLAGGFLGGLLGNIFKDYQSARLDWPHVPTWGKILAITGGGAVMVLSWITMRQFGKRAQSFLDSQKGE